MVLSCFHEDTDGLLTILTSTLRSTSRSANKAFLMARAVELPFVQDAVDAYNRAETRQERDQILSLLRSTFDRKSLQELGFDKTISKHS